MKQEHEFMRRAAELSKQAIDTLHGGPFGSIVVKDGEIIGVGHNHVMVNNDPTAHAEVMAIRDACKKLGTPELVGCELYSSAEPCPMCMAAIYWACIEKVYYANSIADTRALGYEDSIVYDELKKPNNQRKVEMIHLPDEFALQVFKDWKARTEGNT